MRVKTILQNMSAFAFEFKWSPIILVWKLFNSMYQQWPRRAIIYTAWTKKAQKFEFPKFGSSAPPEQMFLIGLLPVIVEKTAVVHRWFFSSHQKQEQCFSWAGVEVASYGRIDWWLWLLDLSLEEAKGEAGSAWASSRDIAGPSVTKCSCLPCAARCKRALLP